MAGVKRRWRNLFGIAAPRLAVRPHVPWYWRALGTTLMLSVSVAVGAWLYDAVSRVAGGQAGYSDQTAALKGRIDELESNLAALRAGAANGSVQQIERTTQDRLATQVKLLEEQNARLKEDLALFERLESIGGAPGLTINGLHVEAEPVPGQYRYRALVALQAGKGDNKDVRVSMQLVVSIKRADGHAMIVFPAANDPDRQRFAISVRHFRRVEGSFQIPEGAQAISVEMRLLQDGATRAAQRVTL